MCEIAVKDFIKTCPGYDNKLSTSLYNDLLANGKLKPTTNTSSKTVSGAEFVIENLLRIIDDNNYCKQIQKNLRNVGKKRMSLLKKYINNNSDYLSSIMNLEDYYMILQDIKDGEYNISYIESKRVSPYRLLLRQLL